MAYNGIDENDEESQSNESSCENDASDYESVNNGSEDSDDQYDDTISLEIMSEDEPEDNGVTKRYSNYKQFGKTTQSKKSNINVRRQRNKK